MAEFALAILAAVLIGYALISKRLGTTSLTGPMLFVGAGLLLGPRGADAFQLGVDSATVGFLLEVSLVIVLFGDAMAIDLRALRQEALLPGRLLGIGLPLTILAGTGFALLLFPELDLGSAVVLSTILAPTDAALGQAVVVNERIPRVVRQGLSVESGLNDGLAVPVLTVALAAALAEAGGTDMAEGLLRVFVEEIGVGLVVGVAVGLLGGWLLKSMRRVEWIGDIWSKLSIPAFALLCFGLADPLGGSGFIAAFVGGAAMGAVVRRDLPDVDEFSEGIGYLLTLFSFLVFGAVMLGPLLDRINWEAVIYAVLALTLLRMIPVGVGVIGTGFSWPTVGFVGWFGPRGLASLVFAVTLVHDSGLGHSELILVVTTVTVGLSVFAHGASAWPLSDRYGAWYETAVSVWPAMKEAVHVEHMGVRRRLRQHGMGI